MTPYSQITNAVKILMAVSLWLIAVTASAQDYEVKCPSFNSPEADFSGVFCGNDLIFCSNRSRMNLSFDDDSLTLYYTDLNKAKARFDGTFSSPEPMKSINTLFNEGHATFSSDGKKMYYSANLKKSL
jgi:Tol biopolymer transport system component